MQHGAARHSAAQPSRRPRSRMGPSGALRRAGLRLSSQGAPPGHAKQLGAIPHPNKQESYDINKITDIFKPAIAHPVEPPAG